MSDTSSNGPSFAELGPFFACDGVIDDRSDWRPLAVDLLGADAVGNWVDAQTRRFAAGMGCAPDQLDVRAVQSALHLGTCARVLSPFVGRIVVAGEERVRIPALDDLLWQPDGTTRFPLALARQADVSADPVGDVVDRLAVPLLSGPLVSSRSVAAGNVVSALNGAATAMSQAWPESAGDVWRIVTRLCEEVARRRGRPEHTGEVGTPGFRRRSCCLLYRLDGVGHLPTCGDCVLDR